MLLLLEELVELGRSSEMIINSKENFVPMIAKLLKGLKYENIKVNDGDNPDIDITAEKDGIKYSFKCRYDIDAIREKYIQKLVDATKRTNTEKAVFVTNSSFLSSAKSLGDKEGILLWDRNHVDRLAIGISEKLDDPLPEEKNNKGLFVCIFLLLLLCLAAGFYYYIK